MKRTYQPKKRKRARAHGFRARMRTRAGRLTLKRRRNKGRKRLSTTVVPRAAMMPRSPNAAVRLSRSAEFERVYRQGRSVANRHWCCTRSRTSRSTLRGLGLSVSRKVGGAVERNHVKRLLREAFDAASRELRAATTSSSWRGRRRASWPSARAWRGSTAPSRSCSDRAGLRWAASADRSQLPMETAGSGVRERPSATADVTRAVAARMRTLVARADRRLPEVDLAGAAAALQVRADVLALRGTGDRRVRHAEGTGARGVALAQVQPVEPRRV